MRELADQLGIEELHELADDMYRKPAVTRAPPSSDPLTPELAEKIRKFHKKNPTMHQRDIGHRFNVNPGRVSESLNNQK
jgi:hypothetical protein